MRLGKVLLTASALILTTAAEQAREPEVRWGMSQAEVEATVPDARPTRPGRSDGGIRVRTMAMQRFGALDLPARYGYGEQGLASIAFEAPEDRCRDLVAVLVADHGAPLRVSDQVLFRLLIWHDEPADRRLRLMYSTAGVCALFYEPLGGYREHDLASAPN